MISILAAGALGGATWVLSEYLLHRFVGHSPRSRTLFAREHRRHHAEGNYFAPNRTKLMATAPVGVVVATLAILLAGPGAGSAYAAGLALVYVGYEVFHRRLHTHAARTRFGRYARMHHFHHHFHEPKKNHGVTAPFLDVPFGTKAVPTQIRVPRRLAMDWLLDADGKLRPELAADYALLELPGARTPTEQAPAGQAQPA